MTQDNKPKGYCKYILAIDSETTGLSFGVDDPSIGHQAVSWGVVVADADTLLPVKKLYLEIKWNEESKAARKKDPTFGEYAQKIHGLSYEYLEEHGIDEADAVVEIVNLILEYWGPNVQVKTLGHNVVSFDIPFLKAMLRRHEIDVPFGSRHYDTNAMGFVTVGSYTSDALFSAMGYDTRAGHNALEDTMLALNCARRIRTLWDDMVGINAYV